VNWVFRNFTWYQSGTEKGYNILSYFKRYEYAHIKAVLRFLQQGFEKNGHEFEGRRQVTRGSELPHLKRKDDNDIRSQ
jgi:hypothetical protein